MPPAFRSQFDVIEGYAFDPAPWDRGAASTEKESQHRKGKAIPHSGAAEPPCERPHGDKSGIVS